MSDKNQVHLEKPYEDNFIKVHFVGKLSCSSYYALESHTNPGYEICLITKGKGFFKTDKVYPVNNEEIFITKPKEIHEGWSTEKNPYSILYICFSFKEKNITEINPWEKVIEGFISLNECISNDKYSTSFIHSRLLEEISQGEIYSKEIIRSLIYQFLLLTLRNFHKEKGEKSNNNILVTEIIKLINENIGSKLNLNIISEILGYSIPHICKTFKNESGFTIMEYYNISRLQKGKSLLLKSNITISNISDNLCFNSISHFSSAFKKMYGYSPLNYRNNKDNLV